jgi:hypothetical protein
MAQLADIHARMAASTRFRGMAPAVVGATGVLALAGAALQAVPPTSAASEGGGYVLFWTAVAILASAMIALEALSRARRFHGVMAGTMIGGTLRLFLPFGAAGAIVSVAIMRVAPTTWWLLPGLWQSFVALLGFAASMTSLPRTIAWVGGWYLLCATLVLTLAGQSGAATPWMMGVPFGIGQVLAGVLLQRAQAESR